MKFTTKTPSLQSKHDLLGLFVSGGKLVTDFGRDVDKAFGGLITDILKKEDFKGKPGEIRQIDSHGKIPTAYVLLIGIGEIEKDTCPDKITERLRKATSKLVRAGNKLQLKNVAIEDFSHKEISSSVRGQAFAEGAVLGDYRYDAYKSKIETKKTVAEVVVLTSEASALQKGLELGAVFAEATNQARDMVNMPACDMTPRRMADEAKKIAKLPGLSVKILTKAEIEKLGMGLFLAVAVGSVEPPYFIHLQYRPTGKPKKKIAIIGKGVTFDSGGLSLKTAQSMETMKDDMSGSAAMVSVMKALSALKLPIEVHGFAAMTENMPSGSAERPGDIARSMNGKTVEILNTDAEGRLTLADALTYAQQQKPDLMIDMATLTGACVVALGELCSGILGNNQDLIDQLIHSGKKAGENLWQLPLMDEYKEELKSSIADLKNVGGRWGGTINGALFLQEFVDSKVPWAHIDIAGPSWTEKGLDYCPRGGTGHIVRTLLHFLTQASR